MVFSEPPECGSRQAESLLCPLNGAKVARDGVECRSLRLRRNTDALRQFSTLWWIEFFVHSDEPSGRGGHLHVFIPLDSPQNKAPTRARSGLVGGMPYSPMTDAAGASRWSRSQTYSAWLLRALIARNFLGIRLDGRHAAPDSSANASPGTRSRSHPKRSWADGAKRRPPGEPCASHAAFCRYSHCGEKPQAHVGTELPEICAPTCRFQEAKSVGRRRAQAKSIPFTVEFAVQATAGCARLQFCSPARAGIDSYHFYRQR